MAYDYPADFLRTARRAVPCARARRRRNRARRAAALRAAQAAVARRRRRRAVRPRHRCAAHVRRAPRRSGRGNAGRQRRARVGSSAEAGRDRRHGLAGGERTRARRRLRARGRHAPAGFHDRLEYAVRAGQADRHQRQCVRCARSMRGVVGRSRCASSASTRCRGARRLARRRRLDRARAATRRRAGATRVDARSRNAPQRDGVLPLRSRRDRRGAAFAARSSPADDIVVCAAGTLAGRPAQALARRARRAAITSNMATRAWATKSPAASA